MRHDGENKLQENLEEFARSEDAGTQPEGSFEAATSGGVHNRLVMDDIATYPANRDARARLT